MSSDTKIVELMGVPATQRDVSWLKESLQAAIMLEFATIPPYLTAFWSVKDQMDPVARTIREIVVEEMLHMALACNLLTAVGGTPALDTPDAVPTYPGPLPGGVHPGLEVSLQRLSRDAAKVFMEIEYPEGGSIASAVAEAFPTIGAFYSAIQAAFEALQPQLAEDRQLQGPLGLSKIASLDQVPTAIELIKRQGEGSRASPEDTGPADLAHFYRFGEIYNQKKLSRDPETGQYSFNGNPVPLPDVWPMAVVPPGGYQQDGVPAEVWQLVEAFDRSFTAMMNALQSAWENGDLSSLTQAISTMYGLRSLAVSLMQMPIPSGGGNYGPCFRLVPRA